MRYQISAGPHAANKVEFDGSGNIMAVASDDHTVKIFGTSKGELLGTLEGHDEAVQVCVCVYIYIYITLVDCVVERLSREVISVYL